MQITSIQITRLESTGTKLRAIANIIFDDMVVVHDIKILESAGTLFLAMPSKSTNRGTFKDVIHPINQAVRKAFEDLLFGAYKRAAEQQCMKAEFRSTQPQSVGLLEQIFEMFELDSAVHAKPDAPQGTGSSHASVDPSAAADDELLKWLES